MFKDDWGRKYSDPIVQGGITKEEWGGTYIDSSLNKRSSDLSKKNYEIGINITLDFLAYLCYKGYRFVLGGFYLEEDMFNRDVDSYATKNADDSEK